MIHLTLPTDDTRRLSFYLAMEEYVAPLLLPPRGESTKREKASSLLPLGGGREGASFFFLWQVEPTVIFGHNQVIENEVNIDYCREHGIQFYRRKSGGGCVYADRSNVMMSYITRSDQVQTTFKAYMQMVCDFNGKQRCAHQRQESLGQRLLPQARIQHRARHHALRHRHAAHAFGHYATPAETHEARCPERSPAHHAPQGTHGPQH